MPKQKANESINTPQAKNMNLDTDFTRFTKIISKLITDLMCNAKV